MFEYVGPISFVGIQLTVYESRSHHIPLLSIRSKSLQCYRCQDNGPLLIDRKVTETVSMLCITVSSGKKKRRWGIIKYSFQFFCYCQRV